MTDTIVISLSTDQALVLSNWLNRKMHTAEMAGLVDDRAVWSSLLKISGLLDTELLPIFDPAYNEILTNARHRLIRELGEFGIPQPDGE